MCANVDYKCTNVQMHECRNVDMEYRFTLKRVCDVIRTQSEYFLLDDMVEHWIWGVQLERGGRETTLAFFENQKKCPDFLKKVLIVSILGLNLSLKIKF